MEQGDVPKLSWSADRYANIKRYIYNHLNLVDAY